MKNPRQSKNEEGFRHYHAQRKITYDKVSTVRAF